MEGNLLSQCVFCGADILGTETKSDICNECEKIAVDAIEKLRNEFRKIPTQRRWEVWERDNFTCRKCGSRKNLEIDHIFPVSKGGDNTIENLQTLCKSCNSKKGNRI